VSLRTKPRRPSRSGATCVIGVILLTCLGCVQHEDVQYFAVVDSEGNQNYFRVTVKCCSLGTDYRMQSGHFSAAAVDVIRGAMPEIPTLDLPLEHARVLDEAVSLYHQRLLRQGYAMVPYQPDRALWMGVAQQIDETRRAILNASKTLDEGKDLQRRLKIAQGLAKRANALEPTTQPVGETPQPPKESPDTNEAQQQALQEAIDKAWRDLVNEAKAAGIEPTAENLRPRARQVLQEALDAQAPERAQAERDLTRLLSLIKQQKADLAKITGTAPPGKIEDVASALALTEAEARPPTGPAATQPALPFGTELGTIDNQLKELARLIWFASLSTQDLIAMGQLRTTDAYQFRKHVIWISATQFNLEKIGGHIDSIINSAIGLASVAKEQAAKRSAQRKAKKKWLVGALKRATPVLGPEAAPLADILFPEGGADAAAPTNALQQLKELYQATTLKGGEE
jgi:hypothetical protein